MSGYTYTQTPLIDESAIRAMPRTGREEALGFGGNTSYFSKAPQEDVDEAQREGKPFYLVRLISPVGADFHVPAHWHSKSESWLRTFTGSVEVTINGVVHTVTPEVGEVHIPMGAVHSILIKKDVHTEMGERVDEDPIQKMQSLRRLMGKGGQEEELRPLQAMRLFYEDGDGYPSTGLKLLDVLMVYFLGGFIGSFLGFGAITASETSKDK